MRGKGGGVDDFLLIVLKFYSVIHGESETAFHVMRLTGDFYDSVEFVAILRLLQLTSWHVQERQ